MSTPMNALQQALVKAGVAREEQAVVETEETKLIKELSALEAEFNKKADVGDLLLKSFDQMEYLNARELHSEKERIAILRRARKFYEDRL